MPQSCVGATAWKEGRIQVLAGLAPSSQTVGSNKEAQGATCRSHLKCSSDAWPENSSKTLKGYNSLTRAARANLTPDLDSLL